MRVVLTFCLVCLLLLLGLGYQTSAKQPVQFCKNVTLPPPIPGAETVSVWAQSARWHCWRAYLPALGAEAADLSVNVSVETQNIYPDYFVETLAAAAEAGVGPDITIQSGALDPWVEAGYLWPLDACRARHATFAQIDERLWSTAAVDEQTYGVPLDVHLDMLFFNKTLLQELGWSEAQIAALPQQIANGRFTLFDMLDVAQRAVTQGVVEPGFGYWGDLAQVSEIEAYYLAFAGHIETADGNHLVINETHLRQTYAFVQRLTDSSAVRPLFPTDPESVWSNRLVQYDAIAHGRVLFWHDNSLETTNLWYDFPSTAGTLFDNFGVAPRPSGISGQPGNFRIRPTFYVVLAERASGRRQQNAACEVLAATVNPELNARQAKAVMGLGTIKNQAAHPAFADHPLVPLVAPFLANSHIVRLKPQHVDFSRTLMRYARAVEAGRFSPDTAASRTVTELERLYGNALIVER